MAKLTLAHLASLASETTAIQLLNDNFDKIVTAIENTSSRDGTSPNAFDASLDMDGNRILNVGTPVSSTDAVRFIDIYSGITLTEVPVPNPAGNAGKVLGTADGITISWITTGGDLSAANNLSDLTNPTTARTNLGLGSAAIANTGTSGHTLGFLDTPSTFSANQAFTAGIQVSNGIRAVGTIESTIEYTVSTLTPNSVGFRGAPPVYIDTDYVFVMNDAGRNFVHSAASTCVYYIPTNDQVPFPEGTAIMVTNNGAGNVTVQMSDPGVMLLRANGSGTSGPQTVSLYNTRTFFKIGGNAWVML